MDKVWLGINAPDTTWVSITTFDNFCKLDKCPDIIAFNTKIGFKIAKWIVSEDKKQKGNFIPKNFTYLNNATNKIIKGNIYNCLNFYLKLRK
jgi:hypothetical protein